jgi:cytochrome c oxidase assembly factor CtaG
MPGERPCVDPIYAWRQNFSNNVNWVFNIKKTHFYCAVLEHFKYLYASYFFYVSRIRQEPFQEKDHEQ